MKKNIKLLVLFPLFLIFSGSQSLAMRQYLLQDAKRIIRFSSQDFSRITYCFAERLAKISSCKNMFEYIEKDIISQIVEHETNNLDTLYSTGILKNNQSLNLTEKEISDFTLSARKEKDDCLEEPSTYEKQFIYLLRKIAQAKYYLTLEEDHLEKTKKVKSLIRKYKNEFEFIFDDTVEKMKSDFVSNYWIYFTKLRANCKYELCEFYELCSQENIEQKIQNTYKMSEDEL